jgi:RimJ/RimL family protein N-acetyltransferase
MVSIEFTYDYDSEFLPIYREFFESEFTGREWFDRMWCIPDNVLEYRLRLKLLERRKDPTQMDLMVIYYNGKPVGLSFPRTTFTEEEKLKFDVEDFKYYKIGSIIVLKEYRNRGIAYDACKLFMERYNPIVYHVDELNHASIKLAIKLGLTFSHRTTINDVNYLVYK